MAIDKHALVSAGCPDQTADTIMANLPPGITSADVMRLIQHVQSALVALFGKENYSSSQISWGQIPQLIAALTSGNPITAAFGLISFFGPPAMKRIDFREGWGVFLALGTPGDLNAILTAWEKMSGPPPALIP